MSHVQAGHGRVSMGGLVSDTEDEGNEDVAGSQVMGSQRWGKGRAKRVASHKCKVQHILLSSVSIPDTGSSSQDAPGKRARGGSQLRKLQFWLTWCLTL